LFSIVGTPRVSYNPVLGAIFNTEANNKNIVDDVKITSSVLIDTTSIGFKGVRNCNTASNGAALIDLLHHVLFTRDRAKFINLVDSVLSWDEAGATAWFTSLANVDRSTFNTVIVTASLVNRASLIGDVILVHEFKG